MRTDRYLMVLTSKSRVLLDNVKITKEMDFWSFKQFLDYTKENRKKLGIDDKVVKSIECWTVVNGSSGCRTLHRGYDL